MTDEEDTAGRDVPDDLLEVLDAVAAMLNPVALREVHEGVLRWSVNGQGIVTWSRGSVSFRVGPDIGAAAMNTPDAAQSTLGRDWVAFSPVNLDSHARDRIGAWFAAAHRRAATTSR